MINKTRTEAMAELEILDNKVLTDEDRERVDELTQIIQTEEVMDKLKEANSMSEVLGILKNSKDKEYTLQIQLFRTANQGGTVYTPSVFNDEYSMDELE